MTRKQKLHLAAASAVMSVFGMSELANGQIYTETFGAGLNPAYTSTGNPTNPGSSTVNVVSGVLTLSSGSPAVANTVRVTTPTSGGGSLYGAYDTILDNNGDSNMLTWVLNIEHSRGSPGASGLASGNYGAAYVLGATQENFATGGSGYAIVIGKSGTDPVQLIKYSAGLQAVGTGAGGAGFNLVAAGADALTRYQSVKVTYKPANDQWELFVRDDGASAFSDAITNTAGYISQGTKVDATYTGTALTHSGFYWAHAAAANTVARFDNIQFDIGAAPVAGPPRNLTWDSDATGAATDGSGTWSTTNAWILPDTTHTDWDGVRPDNAIFGTGGGGGPHTIDTGTGQVAGSLTFNASSPTYTFTGGLMQLKSDASGDGIVANSSVNFNNSGVSSQAPQDWHVNGSGTTVTVNAPMSGSGQIHKWGTGTVVLNNPSPSFSGGVLVETGTVRVTSTNGGISGFGTGIADFNSGSTLHFDASAGPMTFTSTSGAIFMGDDSTLKITGSVTWQKNYPRFSNGSISNQADVTVHADAGAVLLWRAQLRNFSAVNPSFCVIHLDGPGTTKITNSPSNGTVDPDLYAGDWDLSNGTLILGQNTETGGSSGDTLNALGVKNGDASQGNTITVRDTGVLIATEDTANNPVGGIDYYRGNVIMAGGKFGSGNGKNTKWGANFSTTLATTSTLNTYDPLNPGVARTTTLVGGPAGFVNSQAVTTWEGDLVVDPGATTGGAFKILRSTGGIINVTSGATITVNQGATLELGGSEDALSDGTDHVNVTNNSTTSFNVTQGTKNVGNVDGTGNTTINSGVTLRANRIRQAGLTVNGNAFIRANSPEAASGASNSHVNTLTVAGGSTIDLTNNNLIIAAADATDAGIKYAAAEPLVISGFGNFDWLGSGITSSTAAAQAQIDGSRALGIINNTDWGHSDIEGDPVGPNDIIIKYTWLADANVDGLVDNDDFGQFLFGFSGSGSPNWLNGDFDYDGDVDNDDFGSFLTGLGAFQASGNTQLSESFKAELAAFAAEQGIPLVLDPTPVPEPTTLGVLGLAGAGMLSRRRRR